MCTFFSVLLKTRPKIRGSSKTWMKLFFLANRCELASRTSRRTWTAPLRSTSTSPRPSFTRCTTAARFATTSPSWNWPVRSSSTVSVTWTGKKKPKYRDRANWICAAGNVQPICFDPMKKDLKAPKGKERYYVAGWGFMTKGIDENISIKR